MIERATRLMTKHLTLDLLWKLALPACLLISLNLRTVAPHDFWWHLRMGEIILGEGQVPTVDRFSFTEAGAPWVDQNWLMQIAMVAVYRLGGLPLSIVFNSLLITAGYILLLAVLLWRHPVRAAVVGVLLAALVGSQNWGVRPQAFSFLAFSAMVCLIEAHRSGRRRALWWAVPLVVLWANCHGVFLYGLSLLGLYSVSVLLSGLRRGAPSRLALPLEALGAPVLAVLGLGLNPLGPEGALGYVAGFVDSEDITTQITSEWLPLTIRQAYGVVFLASVLLLAIVVRRSRYVPTAYQWIGLVMFGLLALWARRNPAWFGLVLAPVMAEAVSRLNWACRSVRVGRPAANAIVTGLMLITLTLSWPGWRSAVARGGRRDLVSQGTPVSAVDFLCPALPEQARVFADQGFASYLEWACPGRTVFVDTRIDLYPAARWEEYLAVSGGRFDWDSILYQYRTDYLLLSLEAQKHAVRAAELSPRWTLMYRDDRAVIFGRTEAEPPLVDAG